ncbi:MAG TPA: TonB family protein [Candidatus Omnitrophota bacterium]|nr:TonB family protein [Candidatus Omnitrophota bacterium]
MKSLKLNLIALCGVLLILRAPVFAGELDAFLMEEDEFKRPVPTVNNSFFETDIREVLRDISAQTGVKIVPDETVQGSISIELWGVPLEDALRLVLSSGNYSFREMPEGYYLVGLCTPNSPSFNKLSVTDFFQPSYLKAKELQSLISEFYSPYIHVNEDINTITITAAPEVVARLKKDLATLDRPPRQVMIEALVIEISEIDSTALGIAWGPMYSTGFNINMPANEATYSKVSGTSAAKTTTISGTLSNDVIARINTMVARGKAKVKANPRVATLEGKQAELSVGTEEYATIEVGSQGNRYSTLQSISSGVILRITPYLDDKKQITVKIAPEVSEVTAQSAEGLPVITKRTALTTLRVDDGQTIAIGGLIQEQKSESTNKWPILGHIPLIGPALFQHKVTSVQNKEVIILITPRILQDSAFDRLQKMAVSLDRDPKKTDALPPQDPVQKYYYDIGRLIESHKKFPEFITGTRRGESKEVVVEFTVFSDGMISGVTVVAGSGNSFLDENAVRSIEDLSPLPPFPAELKQTSVTFTAAIRYES